MLLNPAGELKYCGRTSLRGSNGIVHLCFLKFSGEMIFAQNFNKGDFRMETIYFLLVVAMPISGMILLLRKINGNKGRYGLQKTRIERDGTGSTDAELEQPRRLRRELEYIDWYLERGYKAIDKRPDVQASAQV